MDSGFKGSKVQGSRLKGSGLREQRTAEPQNQNIEWWNRFALSFDSIKIDRSTLRLSTGRIPSFEIRYLILIRFGGFALLSS